MSGVRLDAALVARGLVRSRAQAKELLDAGRVLVDGKVDGGLPVVVAGLGTDHRPLGAARDLDALARLGLTWVGLVTHHDLDALDAGLELRDLRQLGVEVVAQPVGDVDMASGDGNFHGVLLGTSVLRWGYAWRGRRAQGTTSSGDGLVAGCRPGTREAPASCRLCRSNEGPMTTR